MRAGTGAEVEAFVHGALCVSYSGQCFSSEAWGGRSANRGQCAQACRMPYGLIVDGTIKVRLGKLFGSVSRLAALFGSVSRRPNWVAGSGSGVPRGGVGCGLGDGVRWWLGMCPGLPLPDRATRNGIAQLALFAVLRHAV